MTDFKKNGLVIHENDYGENDKLLVILTERYGKIPVIAKGAKSVRNRHMACCQLFTYASFNFRKKGNFYYITESDLIESYYDIRTDIVKVALASFICDVINDVCQEGNNDDVILRLALNTLFAIAKNTKPLEFIRACFEMRIASELGYSPNIEYCKKCGNKLVDNIYLDIIDGVAQCEKCKSTYIKESTDPFSERGLEKPVAIISESVSLAIQYVCLCRQERFLSFTLDESEYPSFFSVCERFLLHQLERSFYSLEFYKTML